MEPHATCPRLCMVKLQRREEKENSPTAPHSLPGAKGIPHPSTFLLKCRPQKWRKWKRTREKLPLSISQECLAETQGQRGESLPATLTGWNCHSFPPLPASDESRNTHQRRGGGQDTIPALPPSTLCFRELSAARNLGVVPHPILRPQSHQSCQFGLLISLGHKLSSILTKFH